MKKLLLILLLVPLVVSCNKDDDSLKDPIIGSWKSEPQDIYDGKYQVSYNTFSSNGVLTGSTEEIKDGNVIYKYQSDPSNWKNAGSDFEAKVQTYIIGVGDENQSGYFEAQINIIFSNNFKQKTIDPTTGSGVTFIKQ